MNSKKVLAALMCAVMLILTFAGCSSKNPPENKDAAASPPEEVTLAGAAEDVTAITGSTDADGKVIDNKGIIDAEGHKIYDTGYKDPSGNTIYTTGKKDSNGNILYTLNKTDDRGNLIYYTGTVEDGKLNLTPSDSLPDYTTNNNSTLKDTDRYTTTSTVKFEPVKDETLATGFTKKFLNYAHGSNYDMFRKVVYAQDGGYIAAGMSSSKDGIYKGANSAWSTYGVVTKISADGAVEWSYFSGGDADIQFNDVAQLKDGSIVAVGYTTATDTDAPLNSQLVSSLIIKLNKKGELVWSYSFPGDEKSNGDYILCVKATPDGGFVAGGRADSVSGFFNGTKDNFKAFLFKFDRNGNIDWRKTLSGSRGNSITGIDVDSDGNIFALCVSYSSDGSFTAFKGYGTKSNTAVMKFDKKGALKWTSNLVGSGVSEYNAITVLSDGGCLVGGKFSIDKRADGSYSSCYGATDGYIVRYNKDGGVCWARNIGGSADDEVTGVIQTDKGIVVVGKTKSTDLDFSTTKSSKEYDGFVMILSDAGKTKYVEKLAGSSDDYILGTAKTDDGFALVGWTSSADGTFSESKCGKTPDAFFAAYTLKAEE